MEIGPSSLMRQAAEIGELMDATRTGSARTTSREHRNDTKTREAQRRLADLSFSRFMREHNRTQGKG